MSELWYIRRKQDTKGPFPTALVARFIELGRIRDSDEISTDRCSWAAVGVSRERFAVAACARREAAAVAEATAPAAARAHRARPRRVTARVAGGAAGARRGRAAQVAVLVAVMAVIWITGILLVPEPDANPRDCTAAARPGVNWSNCQMGARDLARVHLDGAVLRNARLHGARMLGVRLRAADLAFAELARADLSYGDLSGANVVGADLRGADLAYADFHGADLSYADLSNANLGGANLQGAKLDHAIWIDSRVCRVGSLGGCLVEDVPARQ